MVIKYIPVKTVDEIDDWVTGKLGHIAYDFTQSYGTSFEQFVSILKSKNSTPIQRLLFVLKYYKSKGIIYKYSP